MGPGKLLRYDRTPTPFECDRSEVIIGMPYGRWIARVVIDVFMYIMKLELLVLPD